ncbi:MAG: recombinase, partial [Eubacterium sp.]|nr:recombinase [Eubacterium sp.]
MANVTFIPAKHKIGNNVSRDEVTKLRVAAYCRVSTDSDEQETSYDAQVSHYTE